VGTPSETHYEFAKKILNAGKHALVDKPVTATYAQAHELGALASSKYLVLYPYQNRRWDTDFLALKALLDLPGDHPKSLGNVYEFETRFDRFRTALKGTWKDLPLPANGLTYDLAAHLIDQCLVLFGRPKAITAFIENIRGIGAPGVDDSFTILLQYPPLPLTPAPSESIKLTSFTAILRGAILSVRTPQFRYVVRGTNGTYTKTGVDPQEDQLKAIKSPSDIFQDQIMGKEPENLWGTLENWKDEQQTEIVKSVWPSEERGDYSLLFKDLAACIREGKTPAIPWHESAEVIELIESAYRSASERRTIQISSQAGMIIKSEMNE